MEPREINITIYLQIYFPSDAQSVWCVDTMCTRFAWGFFIRRGPFYRPIKFVGAVVDILGWGENMGPFIYQFSILLLWNTVFSHVYNNLNILHFFRILWYLWFQWSEDEVKSCGDVSFGGWSYCTPVVAHDIITWVGSFFSVPERALRLW